MHMIRTVAACLFLTGIGSLAASAQTRPAETASFAADVSVSVNGLVCDFCAQAIDRSFRRRSEVSSVRVDLTARVVTIDFRPNQNLDDNTIRDIITRAGYAVTDIRRTAPP